jgi:hypothetical protein
MSINSILTTVNVGNIVPSIQEKMLSIQEEDDYED